MIGIEERDMSESAEMPRYSCHKTVHALKIAAIEIHEDGSATIAPADPGFAAFRTDRDFASKFRGSTDDDPGFYVVYEGGYASWSPTKAFVDGYSRIL